MDWDLLLETRYDGGGSEEGREKSKSNTFPRHSPNRTIQEAILNYSVPSDDFDSDSTLNEMKKYTENSMKIHRKTGVAEMQTGKAAFLSGNSPR